MTAVAILVAAVMAWLAQHWVAVRRGTIEFISKHEIGNADWDRCRRVFFKITNRPGPPDPLLALLDPQTPERWAERDVVASVLSYFEGVAVGIRHRAISAKIYKTGTDRTI